MIDVALQDYRFERDDTKLLCQLRRIPLSDV